MTGKKVFAELVSRYGFPEALFKPWAMVEHEEDAFITTPEAEKFTTIRPVRKGIRLARILTHGVKLTTNAAQVLGRHATRNVVELDARQARDFIQGVTLVVDPATPEGFLIVRHAGLTLGVGLSKSGQLKSQVPLSRRTR